MENTRKRLLFVRKRKPGFHSKEYILATTAVSEFWRIARFSDSFRMPRAGRQGGGRFDDPQRIVPILYGADSLATCVYEMIDQLGTQQHEAAAKIFSHTSAATDPDESHDTGRDAAIATRVRRIPPEFYQRCGFHARFVQKPATLFDLTAVGNRTLLLRNARILCVLNALGLQELDIHAITTPMRGLTQAITGELLRGQLASSGMEGIYSISRRNGYIYALFGSTDILSDCKIVEKTKRFSPNDAVIRKIAFELALKP